MKGHANGKPRVSNLEAILTGRMSEEGNPEGIATFGEWRWWSQALGFFGPKLAQTTGIQISSPC